jgi:hypothetical protein
MILGHNPLLGCLCLGNARSQEYAERFRTFEPIRDIIVATLGRGVRNIMVSPGDAQCERVARTIGAAQEQTGVEMLNRGPSITEGSRMLLSNALMGQVLPPMSLPPTSNCSRPASFESWAYPPSAAAAKPSPGPLPVRRCFVLKGLRAAKGLGPSAGVSTLSEALVRPGRTASHSVVFGNHNRSASGVPTAGGLVRKADYASRQVDQAGQQDGQA